MAIVWTFWRGQFWPILSGSWPLFLSGPWPVVCPICPAGRLIPTLSWKCNRYFLCHLECWVKKYLYDANGNVTSKYQLDDLTKVNLTTYQWNDKNQLTAATVDGSQVEGTYDAFGRMVSRNPAGGTAQYFVYDGQKWPWCSTARAGRRARAYGPAVDQILATETVTPGRARASRRHR